ncbi:hypothetical protein [Streptomyces fructofermentans]|uniref:Integral membrane protein n=1 Tax=Streptomyces fructofermentans TaxID=152141 RepID=A0A918NC18_9ACTN|nr:hypothetical protein [Streptomyces fructofermentans]GGX61416.1 hypothetical protein GCM10010515_31660 [Streptomyces fructofermentans]
MDISGIQLRAVRAALFTAVVVTLSTASHVLLSRAPLPLVTVAVTGGAIFAVAYALAGRERGFGRIAALLVPLELAADTLFTTGQHACYGETGGPVAGPLRSVGLDVLCGGQVGAPLARVTGERGERAAALFADADPAAAWLLLGAHVAVGLAAAAWLHRGERALAQLLRAASAATFRPLMVAVAAVAVRRTPARGLPRPTRRFSATRTRLLVFSLGRRGPPCSALAA